MDAGVKRRMDLARVLAEAAVMLSQPMLTRLAEDALSRHKDQRSYEEGGEQVEYSHYDAARDAVRNGELPPHAMFLQLIQETGVTPNLLLDPELPSWPMDSETWDDFYCQVCGAIVAAEMRRQRPKIGQTDLRRTLKYMGFL